MRPSDDANVPVPAGSAPAGLPDSTGGAGSRRGLRARWQGAAIGLLGGALLLSACQGDNLFNGNSATLQPKVVGIALPTQVYPGDTLQVLVSAYGLRQIDRVEISISGAVSLDTTADVAPAVSVTQAFRVPLPLFLADTSVIVRALVWDQVGAVSRQLADTASAVAPPAIVSVSGPDSVRAGTTLNLQFHALGLHPVSRIRVSLSGAVTRQDSILVQPQSTDVTATASYAIAAADVADTTLVVDAQAVDNTGLAGYTTRVLMPMAIPPPSILLVTAPDTVLVGETLDLSVQARGLRNITTFLYSLRGAVTLDNSAAVAVPAREVTQTASFPIPATVQGSLVRLSVTALDEAGVASTAWTDSVYVPTGPPVVDSIVFPLHPDSVQPGELLDVRVYAHGARLLTQIDLGLRGAFQADYPTTISPARASVVKDFTVPLAATALEPDLTVLAKATDSGGNVSDIVQRVLPVILPPPPAPAPDSVTTSTLPVPGS